MTGGANDPPHVAETIPRRVDLRTYIYIYVYIYIFQFELAFQCLPGWPLWVGLGAVATPQSVCFIRLTNQMPECYNSLLELPANTGI